MYLEDDELDQNLSVLLDGSPAAPAAPETMLRLNIYFYEIAECGVLHKKPFLKTYLCRGGDNTNYTFPFIEVDVISKEGDKNEEILNRCLEKLSAEIIQSGDYIANFRNYYKGFVLSTASAAAAAAKATLVFEIPAGQSKTVFMEKCGFVPAILDEIMNRRKIYDVAVDESVQQFFYEKTRFLYLTTRDFENLEIPQILYADSAEKRNENGEYGYFFYFLSASATPSQQRYAAFVEKNVYYSAAAAAAAEGGAIEIENREFNAAAISYERTQKWCLKCPEFFVIL